MYVVTAVSSVDSTATTTTTVTAALAMRAAASTAVAVAAPMGVVACRVGAGDSAGRGHVHGVDQAIDIRSSVVVTDTCTLTPIRCDLPLRALGEGSSELLHQLVLPSMRSVVRF